MLNSFTLISNIHDLDDVDDETRKKAKQKMHVKQFKSQDMY